MIICIADGTAANDAHWTVVQNNVDVMTAATADADGTSGLVPAPAKGKQGQFLRGDGTWATPSTGTDTKNTAGSTNKASTKLFLVGATGQSANPQTYSNSAVYIGTDNCLYSNSTKVSVEGHTHSYASTGHKHTINSHTHSVTIPATAVTVTPTTTDVYSITGKGTLPSLTVTSTAVSKISSWSTGTLPTLTEVTHVTGGEKTSVVTGVAANGTATVLKGVKASGTDTFIKSLTVGSGDLKVYASDDATTAETLAESGRIPYVTAISGSGASASGTVSVWKAAKASGSSSAAPGGHTHTVTVKGTTGGNSGTGVSVVTGITAGSGSLTSDSTATNGIVYVEQQGTFSAGTTPVSSAAPSHTSTNTGVNSGSAVNAHHATYDSNTETLVLTAVTAAPNGHTHAYDKATGVTLTRGTAPSLGAATRKYLHHTHVSASSSGSGTAAPNSHTHSYGSDTALTTSGNSGTNFNAVTGITSNGTATVVTGVTGGSYTFTTKYLEHSHVATTKNATASAVTGVAANGTATALTGVKASGTVEAYTTLTSETINVATTQGTLPSLSYTDLNVGSASGWSAGSLPTIGSKQTVVTGVTAEFPETTVTTGGSGTLTSNTPS